MAADRSPRGAHNCVHTKSHTVARSERSIKISIFFFFSLFTILDRRGAGGEEIYLLRAATMEVTNDKGTEGNE